MMWQSSMLVSLLVLSRDQIYVQIWDRIVVLYRGPITLLEPLMVLISCHFGFGCRRWSKAEKIIWWIIVGQKNVLETSVVILGALYSSYENFDFKREK